MSTIGDNIKKIRSLLGLSQQRFADKLYVTQQSVAKWESNRNIFQADRLKDISENFDIPFGLILHDNEVINHTIQVDITKDIEKLISDLSALKLANNLTYLEDFELSLIQNIFENKGHKWTIHIRCSEYEYNLYKSIKYIYPNYSDEDFLKIIQNSQL